MKWLWVLLACLQVTFLHAQFTPPPNPSQPPPGPSGYLPIVLVNKSGFPDGQINVVITGKDLTSASNQVFVKFNSSGVGSLVFAAPGDNSSNYSQTISQFPVTTDGHVAYVPQINSALIFFSVDQPLSMPVNPPNAIVQPNFSSPSDPNYNTIFDIFEFAYVNTTPNIAADATAVSFFSIPLYGFISTPSSNSASNSGLYQPKNYIFSQAQSFFAGAPEASQWNNLILKNGSTALRILAPEKAMSTVPPLFDPNYLDNAAAYGYSYIGDIWTGLSSFYRKNPLQIQIPTTNRLYTGVIQPDNTIVFTSGSNIVTFAAPTTTSITTTRTIFGGLPLNNSDNSGTGDGVQVSKLFEEAIIAGLVPTANTLSNDYLFAHQSSYYTVNPNLSVSGQTTGPWYDLYSKALHSLGTIYTFAFDEPLWPQVLISSDTLAANTYLGVTIGNLTNLPTTTTTLTSSMNPIQANQPVTLTATVASTSGTPTGSVTFSVDGTMVSTAALVNGQAIYQTSNLAAGNHTFAANYSGDASLIASASAPLTEVVTSSTVNTTTTVLASSVNPAQVGQPVTFTAEVKSASGTPTSSVTFSVDGAEAATVSLTNGQASYQTSSLSVGSHTLVASYLGDSSHLASVSTPITEVITPSTPNTTTMLTSSVNPAQVDQAVTFTAKVTSPSGTPTGSVTFSIDGVRVTTASLTNEQASYQTSNLSVGNHIVVADYSGDSSHLPSSASLLEIIQGTIIFPPRDLKIKQVENEFATQADLINMMTWKAPKQGNKPAAYRIYRDRKLTRLVAVIPSHEDLRFNDHNRKKGKRYHYFIVSVDALDQFSVAAEISVGE